MIFVSSRALTAAALTGVLLLSVTACGSDDEAANTDAATTTVASADQDAATGEAGLAAEAGIDLEDPGDDLLDSVRWGGEVPGDTVKGSWKFPEAYETTGNVPNNKAELQVGDNELEMGIGSYAGRESFAERAEGTRQAAEDEGQETTLEELTIAGGEYVMVTQEEEGLSRRTLFHDPGEGKFYYVFQITSETTLAETPPEQLKGYYQFVASFETEPI